MCCWTDLLQLGPVVVSLAPLRRAHEAGLAWQFLVGAYRISGKPAINIPIDPPQSQITPALNPKP